ncbi:MAG: ABC transporter substrate-binding protein [Vicinamibacterales bacterium]
MPRRSDPFSRARGAVLLSAAMTALVAIGSASLDPVRADARDERQRGAGVVEKASQGEATVDWLVSGGEPGSRGGQIVAALRAEPRTLNPLTALDNPSREVLRRVHADLVTIDRQSHQTELALASSYVRSPDGTRLRVRVRRGLRFSDGQPFGVDDVLFSFRVFLDPEVDAQQRDLLEFDGKPLVVRKVDADTVEFVFPTPYAPAERVFDSVPMLPRHLLESAYKAKTLAKVWTLDTPPGAIAGMGPFRLRQYVPGQRITLERNPYYWKRDRAGTTLPYVDTLTFLLIPDDTAYGLRFEAGDLDIVERVGADAFERLTAKASGAAGAAAWSMRDLGAGLDFTSLVFNLNDLTEQASPDVRAHQEWFRDRRFRQAIAHAVDRQSVARLVYRGRATPMWGFVTPGNRQWLNAALPAPARSVAEARRVLSSAGFSWTGEGALVDARARPVAFTLLTSAGNAARLQMATLIESDLKALGIRAAVVQLEFRAMLERVMRTHDYDTALMSLGSGDVDPGADLNVWRSTGSTHLWRIGAAAPLAPWESEVDQLLERQMSAVDRETRKALVSRVQDIVATETPLVCLVSPNVLVGAKPGLANFRPGILSPHTLWNADELYWRRPPSAPPRGW